MNDYLIIDPVDLENGNKKVSKGIDGPDDDGEYEFVKSERTKLDKEDEEFIKERSSRR